MSDESEQKGRALAPGQRWIWAGIALAAVAHYVWNLFQITPLTGYDGPAHAGYIATIAMDGRLPLPREGWSTFHPPLYYLVCSVVWHLFGELGPRSLLVALRSVSMLSMFGAVAALAWILARRSVAPGVRALTVAVALFVPAVQFAGTFVGNEAFGVLWASLAIVAILRLQEAPGDVRAAAAAGACAGLAMATKYTGLFVAIGCLVPFARAAAWPAARRSLPWLLVALALLGGPAYLRNLALTGSPIPMTRDQGFHAKIEEGMTLRPRALGDFGPPSWESILRPTLFHVEGEPQPGVRWNESMQNVWGLGYATLWYDGAGNRVAARYHRDGILWGPALMLLALVPMGLLIAGFVGATRECLRSRLEARDAPLVVMSFVGLALYVGFTIRAPAIVAAKGSYLLPLLVPSGVFFARAVEALPRPWRVLGLTASGAAALLAAIVFATSLVFPPIPIDRVVQSKTVLDRVYPTAHIGKGVDRLLPPSALRTRVGPPAGRGR